MGFDPSRRWNARGMYGDMGAGRAWCLGLSVEDTGAGTRNGCFLLVSENFLSRSQRPSAPEPNSRGRGTVREGHRRACCVAVKPVSQGLVEI